MCVYMCARVYVCLCLVHSTISQYYYILTDSLSLVTKLEHTKIKEACVLIVKNIQGTVEIVYTPR
jgi:hypothetical protein